MNATEMARQLKAAGERHLAEFIPGSCGSSREVNRWGIVQTSIDFRLQNAKNAEKLQKEAIRNRSIKWNRAGNDKIGLERPPFFSVTLTGHYCVFIFYYPGCMRCHGLSTNHSHAHLLARQQNRRSFADV